MIQYTAPQLIKLLSFAFLMAAGQILFKRVSMDMLPAEGWRSFLALGTNLWFILAISIYIFATLLWIGVLREMPLSRAYPFIAIGFVLVPLAGHLFFAEALDTRYFIGVGLIIAGIAMTVRTA